jgi:hypothetical protein
VNGPSKSRDQFEIVLRVTQKKGNWENKSFKFHNCSDQISREQTDQSALLHPFSTTFILYREEKLFLGDCLAVARDLDAIKIWILSKDRERVNVFEAQKFASWLKKSRKFRTVRLTFDRAQKVDKMEIPLYYEEFIHFQFLCHTDIQSSVSLAGESQ